MVKRGATQCLAVNGIAQSCVELPDYAPTVGYIEEVAKVIRDKQQRAGAKDFKVLLLGLGAGNIVKLLPPEAKVDIVEIDPRVVVIAKKYFNLHLNKNQKIAISDARAFLRHNKEKYDVIFSDLFLGGDQPPHLFSQEALHLQKSALRPNGLILMNVVAHFSPKVDDFAAAVLNTAASIFPSATITSQYPDSEHLQDSVIYISLDKNYQPHNRDYKIINADFSKGEILTDSKNRLKILSEKVLTDFRNHALGFGGYKIFFSL